MEVSQRLTKEIIAAAAGILQPYCQELSPADLVEAIQNHKSGKSTTAVLQAPLTYKEFAKLTGISLPTVHRMTKRGDLPKIKIGLRAVRIPYWAVEKILDGSLKTEVKSENKVSEI